MVAGRRSEGRAQVDAKTEELFLAFAQGGSAPGVDGVVEQALVDVDLPVLLFFVAHGPRSVGRGHSSEHHDTWLRLCMYQIFPFLLEHQHPDVPKSVCAALQNVDHSQFITAAFALLEQYPNDSSEHLRLLLQYPESSNQLVGQYVHRNMHPSTWVKAVEFVSRHGDQTYVQAIAAGLLSWHRAFGTGPVFDSALRAAIRAYASLGGQDARDALEALLTHNEIRVRSYAAEQMGAVGGSTMLPLLKRRLGNWLRRPESSPSVRTKLQEAVTQLEARGASRKG